MAENSKLTDLHIKTAGLTFVEYVRQRRITNSPAGDFTRDAQNDSEFPDVKSWDELSGYLYICGASREAHAAARFVWHRYSAYRRRTGR